MTETPPVLTESASADTTAQQQLRELTSQSWNLELIISGVALFATLSLPGLLDTVLIYYRYNLMPETDYLHDVLPAQILGLTKGVCYVLFLAFLANFVMRAFWIGLVGLLAVYPDGIRYDKLPNLSRYAQQRYAQELGTLPAYIIRLDRRCNVIFALAFGLALMILGVAAIYGLFLGVMTLLQLILPANIYQTVRETIFIVLIAAYTLVATAILVLNLPRFRNHERAAPLSFRLSKAFSLLFMGLYQPLLYIMYTFTSHIPQAVVKRRMVILIAVFVVAEVAFLFVQTVQILGASSLLNSRSYFSLRDQKRTANANMFDNLRPATDLIDQASMQADVIREPYVRLFIAYPKLLDAELAKRYPEPTWPQNLSRKALREQRALWYQQTLGQYFGLSLNEVAYPTPEFLFTKRPDNDQYGLTTVLLPGNLKPGRNILTVTAPDSSNKPTPYCQIPFWYVPEK